MPKNKVAPIEAGRLLPSRRGIPNAANKLLLFLGLKAFDITVLSPYLPAVSKAIRVIKEYPFLNRKIGPGSNMKLLTLLIPFDDVMTGLTSKLNPNLSLHSIFIPVANPIEKVFEKFQLVVLLEVDTIGRKKLVYTTVLGYDEDWDRAIDCENTPCEIMIRITKN